MGWTARGLRRSQLLAAPEQIRDLLLPVLICNRETGYSPESRASTTVMGVLGPWAGKAFPIDRGACGTREGRCSAKAASQEAAGLGGECTGPSRDESQRL